ncbi:hypothetical protein SAMN05192529_13120 [Arachidicoccus rhizosphaerae]|uniref:Uncharacterized protein n=1 Tax=Arachidicoccus rhizosphaerae TaxID=551991 RepID=A0A1H4CFC6_9BACT|nr:hypothetical protein [Arachidicoccus rhizosphaerae]SEA59019.1 hypothetical protein SAMN05192529_13120 [Arachidicoccus rhizosphaerae]
MSELVKIWGTGNVIEKGKMMEADKPTADILVKQGKASFDPVEKTKENGGVIPPVDPPSGEPGKEPAEPENPAAEPEKDKGGKGNGKGK